MLLGGEKRYRGRFKLWCAEASLVCWLVGKKHIEEDSNIGVLKALWCVGGLANRYSERFNHWYAEASMVCWWVGKKEIEVD